MEDQLKNKKKPYGTVLVFGRNDSSQLGLAQELSDQLKPVILPTLKKHKVIITSAGGYHSLALTDGGVIYSWGKSSKGQLGYGDEAVGYIPMKVNSKKKFASVVAGQEFTLALTDKGKVFSWGRGAEYQLGYPGEAPLSSHVPRPIPGFDQIKVFQIAAGTNHSAAIGRDSSGEVHLFTWGSGGAGQLGNNSDQSIESPRIVQALAGIHPFSVCCGSEFTMVLTDRNDVFVFGSGSSGKLGLGHEESALLPLIIPSLAPKDVILISAGQDHAAAVTAEGDLYTWGYGSNGRCGHGSELDCFLPTKVNAFCGRKISNVACGGHHTLALTDSGELFSFGWNQCGQLGFGTKDESVLVPKKVSDLANHKIHHLSCGDQHSIIVASLP